MAAIFILLLTLVEIPFVLLCWLDYFWNLIWKSLSGISAIFVIPSILTIPITVVNSFILTTIIYLKHSLNNQNINFDEAAEKHLARFPEL